MAEDVNLEKLVYEALAQKSRRKEYDLFISHSWSYDDEYERMVELLEEFPYFEFKNYSVPSTDPLDADDAIELLAELFSQVKQATVVIILSGMYVNHSTWIKIEVAIANILDKPMIGVVPWGNENTPTEVQENVDRMVGWQATSVVEGVRELAE